MLATERLLLRKPRLDDASALVEAISDPETMRYIGDGTTGGLDAAKRAITRWLERWDESGVGQFVIARREDERYIGRVGFLVWDPEIWEPCAIGEGAEVEIGWMLVRSQWGNGYATEAAVAARDWIDRPRLVSLIQHGNERSVRVAEKIGESYERDVVVRGVQTRMYSLER